MRLVIVKCCFLFISLISFPDSTFWLSFLQAGESCLFCTEPFPHLFQLYLILSEMRDCIEYSRCTDRVDFFCGTIFLLFCSLFHPLPSKGRLDIGTVDPICTVPLPSPGQNWGNLCKQWPLSATWMTFILSHSLFYFLLEAVQWYYFLSYCTVHKTKINFLFCDAPSGCFFSPSGPNTSHMIVWDCRRPGIDEPGLFWVCAPWFPKSFVSTTTNYYYQKEMGLDQTNKKRQEHSMTGKQRVYKIPGTADRGTEWKTNSLDR